MAVDHTEQAAMLLEALTTPADRRTPVTGEISRRIVEHIVAAARGKP